MSKFLNEYYGDDWRQKVVSHRTPTGRTTRVKVGSLPPKEQLRYNPNRYKRSGADTKMTKSDFEKLRLGNGEKRTADIYIGTTDLDVLDKLSDDKLVLATIDSTDVINLFGDKLDVIKLSNIPMEAIKKYMANNVDKIDSVDDIEFKDIETDDEEKIYEIVKFGNSTVFMVDVKSYLDEVDIVIDTAIDDEDDLEELKDRKLKESGFFNYYLNENIEYHVEDVGSCDAYNSYTLKAYNGDMVVGYLDYAVSDYKVSITMIEIGDNYKNCEIGRKLIIYLQHQYTKIELDWGDKYHKLYQKMIDNGELYIEGSKNEEDSKTKFERFIKIRDAIEIKLNQALDAKNEEDIVKYNNSLENIYVKIDQLKYEMSH